MNKQGPTVTLSYAQSIDGAIAARRGEQFQISGAESLRMTHQLRAQHDAILVGVGTVLADDPKLTVRLVEGKNPQPIILDSQLRCPVSAELVKNGAWIVTTTRASIERERELVAAGARVQRLRETRLGQVGLPELLSWLELRGINSLMVEGGAQVIESFLHQSLVNEVVITIAPVLLGGLKPIAQLLPHGTLKDVSIEQMGEDVVIRGSL